jgi:DNA-binding IclR family transcriptional regulator
VLQALAQEPLHAITSADVRRRHGLPGSSSVQRALDALQQDELVAKERPGAYRIAEPFLREWVLRAAL